MKSGMQEMEDELVKLRARGIGGLSLSFGDIKEPVDRDSLAREAAKILRVMNDPNTKWRKEPPEGM